jgi:hypothetical protein
MRTLLHKLEETFADAALLEMGIYPDRAAAAVKHCWKERLEENFVEIAFAEAADYEDIHKAILREQAGSDICFAH